MYGIQNVAQMSYFFLSHTLVNLKVLDNDPHWFHIIFFYPLACFFFQLFVSLFIKKNNFFVSAWFNKIISNPQIINLRIWQIRSLGIKDLRKFLIWDRLGLTWHQSITYLLHKLYIMTFLCCFNSNFVRSFEIYNGM